MKKRIFAITSVFMIAASGATAGAVVYVAPVEQVIVEETEQMAGSGLWLIPLLAIALIVLMSQSGSN